MNSVCNFNRKKTRENSFEHTHTHTFLVYDPWKEMATFFTILSPFSQQQKKSQLHILFSTLYIISMSYRTILMGAGLFEMKCISSIIFLLSFVGTAFNSNQTRNSKNVMKLITFRIFFLKICLLSRTNCPKSWFSLNHRQKWQTMKQSPVNIISCQFISWSVPKLNQKVTQKSVPTLQISRKAFHFEQQHGWYVFHLNF